MRKTALVIALAVTMLPLAGFAQQPPEAAGTSPPPAPVPALVPHDVAPLPGSPLQPGAQTGLDIVASDGVSTKTVKAVPCGTAARETDGFTTCVGIPNELARKHRTH
jgi:hypothetical protein